jgi:hypothetical protein
MFPAHYHPYLRLYKQGFSGILTMEKLLSSLPKFTDKNAPLPKARQKLAGLKYLKMESYKEIGLKTLF